jgi:RNA polymerase-interacting CarD/CdnL/TRCF family regulator
MDVVKQIQSGKDQYYYSLESRQARFKGAKFVIDVDQVETSGFHPVICSKEANRILAYLKTKDPKDKVLGSEQPKIVLGLIEKNTPWTFAKVVLIFSHEKDGKVAKGKREMFCRAARGLVSELSYALEVPEEEALLRVKKCLQSAKANVWVYDVLASLFS